MKKFTTFESIRNLRDEKGYKTITELQKGCYAAYKTAKNNNWLDLLFERKIHPNGFWTLERCIQEKNEKGYITITDMQNGSPAAHAAVKRNGWEDKMNFVRKIKPNGYWNFDTIKKEWEELGRPNLRDFSKLSPSAALYAGRLRIIDKLGIERIHNPLNYWTHDMVLEDSRRFETWKEYRENSPVSYGKSLETGWNEEMTWLKRGENVTTDKVDNVYAYFFDGLDGFGKMMHHVYVGRSVNKALAKRHRAHCGGNEDDAVYRFSIEHQVDVPELKILKNGLLVEEGLYFEDFYVKQFKDEGWNVLNKAKTGVRSGSMGSIGHRWTFKKVKKLVEDAAKTKDNTFDRLEELYPGIVSAIRRNNWQNELPISRRRRILTKEIVLQIASNFTTLNEFMHGDPSAYAKALELDCVPEHLKRDLLPAGWYKDDEKRLEVARKCNSSSEYQKKFESAWKYSRSIGEEFPWFSDSPTAPRPVLQFTLDGKLIGEYASLSEAAKLNGLKRASDICAVCKGKQRSAYGYLWRYGDVPDAQKGNSQNDLPSMHQNVA